MGSFWQQLPTEGRWLLSTVAFQTLGRGLTLPFTIVYLNEVRGFDLDLSGTLMALIAVVALLATGPGGIFTDRVGARRVLLVGFGSMMVGSIVLAFATTPWAAALGLALIGVNFGVTWPAFNAVIAEITTGDLRLQYFGINFALVNLGIGVGGIIGGLYVDVSEPRTFTTIFLVEAASTLIPIGLMLGPLRHVAGRPEATTEDTDDAGGSYLAILRQPAMAVLVLLTFFSVFVGYGQLEAGLPAFTRQVSEVSTRTLGIAFAVNTGVIVAFQFFVLGRIRGKRRTRVMLVMSGTWVAAWVLLGTTGLAPASMAAAAGVLAFMGVFALGETMLQPTIPAVTNDLATDRTRGRYNALSSAAFQGGAIAGPIAAGLLLDRGWGNGYVAVMVAGCVAVAALALVLERRIPAAANGLVEPDPVSR
ncbi:MFS transporter [Nocardioides panacisoli]|uniref:MFS transporter n=1 Tax=Nocardioides panacisoli TaxID=627624 RepID=UPI001F008A7E|nr:MFS transporter [Nocardioides panacisoli]